MRCGGLRRFLRRCQGAAHLRPAEAQVAVSALMSYLKGLHYVAGVPRLNALLNTLGRARWQLLSFTAAFAVMLVAFSRAAQRRRRRPRRARAAPHRARSRGASGSGRLRTCGAGRSCVFDAAQSS